MESHRKDSLGSHRKHVGTSTTGLITQVPWDELPSKTIENIGKPSKALIRPSRALEGPQGPDEALKSLIIKALKGLIRL